MIPHTVGDAGVKVVGDGMIKLFVDRIDELLLGVGHEKERGKGRGGEGRGGREEGGME